MVFILFIHITSLIFTFSNASPPPAIFVDKGACPFECCTYREWTVEKDTELFDKIDGKKIIGKAVKGTKIQGVTGEVHTIPLKTKTEKGHEVYLLTYQGEGFWKTWDDGIVKENVELLSIKKHPQSTWWVLIKLPDGKTGWTKNVENFGNIDACG